MVSPEQTSLRAEVLVATSWDCNLRCQYCFLQKRTHSGGRRAMSASEAKRLVDTLDEAFPEVERISIHLYGGEPLLHLEPARAMVERTRTKKPHRFSFVVTTNGTIASDDAIALLRDAPFEVVLSVDGPAPIHDQCRPTAGGAPTHHHVLRFLERLRQETRCWVRGSAVVRAGWSLKEAVTYLQTLDVDAIKAQSIRVPTGAPFALRGAEKRRYFTDLDAIGQTVIAELEAGRSPRDDRFSTRVLQLLKGERRPRFCGAGLHVFGVTPEGEIRPCLLLDGPALGTLRSPPSEWRAAGRKWVEARAIPARCDHCHARPLCGGGCPALLPVCGTGECDIIRRNATIARRIHRHFRRRPESLLPLAGIK